MTLIHSLTACLTFISLLLSIVSAFDISKDPLKSMKLSDEILGIHSVENKISAPPSTIISTWYTLMKKNENDAAKIGNGCPDDSTLCGIIKVDGKDSPNPIQLFSVSDKDVIFETDSSSTLPIAKWNDVTYGDYSVDVSVYFKCGTDDNLDIIELNNMTSPFITENIQISWINKQFCAGNNNKDGGNRGDDNKDVADSGLGFFGMSFLIGAVAFAGYLVAQAWYNASTMGSSSDFFNELVDIAVESISSIPRLIMEVINKITGSNSNSSRGGYSAV